MLTSVGALAMLLATAMPAPMPSPTPPVPGGQQSKAPVISDTIAEIQCETAECDLGARSTPAKAAAPVAESGPGQPPPVVCYFTLDPSFIPPSAMSPADSHVGEAGSWMREQCSGNADDILKMGKVLRPMVGDIVWVPAAAPVSPSALAQVAYKQLKPPVPTLVLSPPSARPELVGMPLWLSIPAAMWAPLTARASAGGASVTATATPMSVTWSMGDGGRVTCHGPGTPYPSDPAVHPPPSSPTCGYTYQQPSDTAREGSFPVTATVDWQVAWSGTGNSSGTFPNLRTSSGTQVQVTEVQALVTGVYS